MARNIFLVLGSCMLLGCAGSTGGSGGTPTADSKSVGTSPYTNCDFDSAPSGETFDTVILNGRVMDPECNFDGVRNVGIKNGRIALITQGEISGNRTIDAAGHAVVPGFINTHSHSFVPFDQKMMAHDGTTTLLDTEGGVADAPFFYERYAGKSFVNYGTGISHEAVRRVVLDRLSIEGTSDPSDAYASRAESQEDGHPSWALDVPSPEQHREILRLFEQGMRDGAISVNSTVGYMGSAVPTYEMLDLQRVAKKYERFFGAHTRFGPNERLPLNYSIGVREVIANAVALDGALILSHINNQNWQESYELARRLQHRGMNIFAEYYPAVTGNPSLSALTPAQLEANGIDPTKHVYNPDTGELFETREAFDKMFKEQPGRGVFMILRPQEWMKQWPHMKDVAIGCDSLAFRNEAGELLSIDADPSEYGGHPRAAGTYGIVFREAREQGIPLMDMVNNASYIPAKYFARVGLQALAERGRMQVGMIADITIFDPDTIAESSTMKEGERGLYTKGIPYVLVNGELIIDAGVANTKLRAGQPIRYPLITEGEIELEYGDREFQWDAHVKDREDGLSQRDWVPAPSGE